METALYNSGLSPTQRWLKQFNGHNTAFKWTITKRTPIFDLVTFVSQQQHTPSSLKLPKVSAWSGGPPILTLYQPLPLTVTFTNHLGNSTPPQKIFLCRCKIHLTYFDYPDACCGVRFLTWLKRTRSFSRLKHLTWCGFMAFGSV